MTDVFELGGYFRSCFFMKVGKVLRYSTFIACYSVVIVGEKRDAW